MAARACRRRRAGRGDCRAGCARADGPPVSLAGTLRCLLHRASCLAARRLPTRYALRWRSPRACPAVRSRVNRAPPPDAAGRLGAGEVPKDQASFVALFPNSGSLSLSGPAAALGAQRASLCTVPPLSCAELPKSTSASGPGLRLPRPKPRGQVGTSGPAAPLACGCQHSTASSWAYPAAASTGGLFPVSPGPPRADCSLCPRGPPVPGTPQGFWMRCRPDTAPGPCGLRLRVGWLPWLRVVCGRFSGPVSL